MVIPGCASEKKTQGGSLDSLVPLGWLVSQQLGSTTASKVTPVQMLTRQCHGAVQGMFASSIWQRSQTVWERSQLGANLPYSRQEYRLARYRLKCHSPSLKGLGLCKSWVLSAKWFYKENNYFLGCQAELSTVTADDKSCTIAL